MLQSTAVYAVGIVAQRALSVLLLPLYTIYLTPADYGILELIDVTMALFSLVVGARVATAVAFFCGQENDENGVSKVFTTNLLGSLLAALLALLMGWFAAPRLGLWVLGTQGGGEAFLLAVAGLAAGLPLESMLGRLRVQDKPGWFTGIGVVRLILLVAFNLLFLAVLGLGYKSLLWSNLIVSGLLSVYAVWATTSEYGVRMDWKLFGAMIRFAVPVGAVGLSLFVFHVADRFFLRRYASLEDIGLYALGYKFGMLVSYVQMAFNQYWSAKSYDLLKSESGPVVFSRTFTYYCVVMASATLATWILVPRVIHLLVAPAFFPAIAFVPIILAAYFVRALADYVRIVFYSAQRPGLDALSNGVSALFCLAAYAILIPRFGARGAAWATLLTSLVMAAMAYLLSSRVRPLRLQTGRVIRLLAGSLAVILVYAFARVQSPVLWLIEVIALAAFYFVVVVWLGVFDENDRRSLRALIGRTNTVEAANKV